MDPYQTLGVAQGATQDEIKAAYRRLAKKLHPDLNPGDKKAEDRFKQVNQAFDAIGEADRRKLYDEFGEAALKPGFDAAKARAFRRSAGASAGSPFGGGTRFEWGPFGDGGGGGGAEVEFDGDLEDLLEQLRGGGARARGARGRGRPRARRGADVRGDVVIDLAEAVHGATKAFEISGGAGVRRLKVKVPPGADDGTTIRLAGQGGPGTHGGDPGDLLLSVRVRPHPVFERDGRDLVIELPVTVGEAAAGAVVRVPTFDGDVNLKVPAASSSGTRLRLRGRGLPGAGAGGGGGDRGDLIAVVKIVLPPASPELAEAANALDRLYQDDVRAHLKR